MRCRLLLAGLALLQVCFVSSVENPRSRDPRAHLDLTL